MDKKNNLKIILEAKNDLSLFTFYPLFITAAQQQQQKIESGKGTENDISTL